MKHQKKHQQPHYCAGYNYKMKFNNISQQSLLLLYTRCRCCCCPLIAIDRVLCPPDEDHRWMKCEFIPQHHFYLLAIQFKYEFTLLAIGG